MTAACVRSQDPPRPRAVGRVSIGSVPCIALRLALQDLPSVCSRRACPRRFQTPSPVALVSGLPRVMGQPRLSEKSRRSSTASRSVSPGLPPSRWTKAWNSSAAAPLGSSWLLGRRIGSGRGISSQKGSPCRPSRPKSGSHARPSVSYSAPTRVDLFVNLWLTDNFGVGSFSITRSYR